MAGTTLNRDYPYPTGTDANDVPFRMQALAEAVDADVEAISNHVAVAARTRTSVVTVTTDSIGYATVTHGLGVTPLGVAATMSGNPLGGVSNIATQVATDSFTATTFRVRVFSTTGTAIASTTLTILVTAYIPAVSI